MPIPTAHFKGSCGLVDKVRWSSNPTQGGGCVQILLARCLTERIAQTIIIITMIMIIMRMMMMMMMMMMMLDETLRASRPSPHHLQFAPYDHHRGPQHLFKVLRQKTG